LTFLNRHSFCVERILSFFQKWPKDLEQSTTIWGVTRCTRLNPSPQKKSRFLSTFFLNFFKRFFDDFACSVRGGFFSPVRRRIGTASGASGIVVSPDKKANLAEAATRIENILDNAKATSTAAASAAAPPTPSRQPSSSSPLRTASAVPAVSAAAAAVPSPARAKRVSTPAATPNKKRATGTPAAASPLRTQTAAAAELAQTCFEAEKAQLELQLSKLAAEKNAEIERLETEFFSALFLALKLSLTEQKTRFNNKIDACDLLASARRQQVPFTTAALTTFIDRSLRVATRGNSRQSLKK
jgi:hypothetical protein